MDVNDRDYYLRRALQEQEAARNAACLPARERHEELAKAYRLRCRLDATATNPLVAQNSEAIDYAA